MTSTSAADRSAALNDALAGDRMAVPAAAIGLWSIGRNASALLVGPDRGGPSACSNSREVR